MTKSEALAKFLEIDLDCLDVSKYDDNAFEYGHEEYLVLTDQEADDMAKERILDSVWAFKPEFLANHCVEGVDAETIESIQNNERCESNNAVLTRLIADVDHFVNDAIAADGRGHFLAGYDNEENESGEFFIYRTN